MASRAASMQAIILRLNSTCSRTCQSSTRATRRFQPCTIALMGPPRRGFTDPMAATLPIAASRACTSGIRSGRGISTPPAAVCGLRARTRSRTSCRMASSSALSTRLPPGPAPGCGDRGAEAAPRREIADYGGGDRAGRLHHVPQHAVHYVLLKDAEVAIGQQIHFVRFELEAELIGHVAQPQPAEIG